MIYKLPAVLWTMVSLAGLFQIWRAHVEALYDRALQRRMGYNGELQLIVEGDVLAARVLLLPFILISIVGLISVITPTPPPPAKVTLVATAFGYAAVSTLISFVAAVVYVVRLRREVRRKGMAIARRRELGEYPPLPHESEDEEPIISYHPPAPKAKRKWPWQS